MLAIAAFMQGQDCTDFREVLSGERCEISDGQWATRQPCISIVVDKTQE